MAVTAHTYNHLSKLIANQELSKSSLRLVKLSASASRVSSIVTITIANPGVVSWTAHGRREGSPIILSTTANLPAGLVAGVTYFAKNVTTNAMQLSATPGGVAIQTTGTQSGTHTAVAPFTPSDTTLDQVAGGTKATVTITIANPGVVSWTAHALPANTPIVFKTSVALPTGLTAGTTYYVKSPNTNDFQVSATPGGASIQTTGRQSGVHQAMSVGTFESYGNGWGVFGGAIANVAGSTVTTNDAKIAGDQVSATASGGSISARFIVLVDFSNWAPLIFYDLGQIETAGDTTDFKVSFDLAGVPGTIINLIDAL